MGNGAAGRRSGFVAWLAALVALVAIAGLAGAALVVRPWADASETMRPPRYVAEPPPPAVLTATGTDAPALTPDQVGAAIGDLVTAPELGDRVGVSVVDLVTGEVLFDRAADTPAMPASTIKLVTGATVLAAHGPTYRIPTLAVAGAQPGEVVLVGGGDPTLARDEAGFYPGAARLDLLAEQVLTALGDTPVTQVTVDSGLFTGEVYGPWTSDIPTGGYVGPITALMTDGARKDPDPDQAMSAAARSDEPDLAAGRAFAELLDLDPDEDVSRGQAPSPPDGEILGEVFSPPLLRLVEMMLETSDNVLAEALARQVALARDEPASFPGAAAATAAVLTGELGVDLPPESRFADGSGLSRDNLVSAGLLTDLLLLAAGPQRADLGGLLTGLPVAGWSGTLLDRHEAPPEHTEAGLGVVRAKTGTLNGVDSLAGVVVTASGRSLGFALIADQVTADHTAARTALDRIPAALAVL